ncbi:MAG: TlpA family protein disulfide reductase, partial [Tannerella sp.]|nr:TlpA family protein disulfide reductase [Tannerella sp.]
MKTINYLSIILLGMFLCQCEKRKSSLEIPEIKTDKTVIITGFIKNRNLYPNTKEIQLNIPDLTAEAYKMIVPIEEDSTFHFRFDLNQPQDAKIETFLEFIYLCPGDSLHVELDFANLMTAKFSGGKAAEINEDFYQYFNQTAYRNNQTGGIFNIGTDMEMNGSTQKIIHQLDSLKQYYSDRRDTFLSKEQVCDEVVFLTKAMMDLDYYGQLIHIAFIRNSLQVKNNFDVQKLREDVYNKAVPYYSKGLYSTHHFQFINSYAALAVLNGQVSIEILQGRDSSYVEWFQWVDKISVNDTIKDFLTAYSASAALSAKDFDFFEKIYPEIKMEYLNGRIMDEYQETLDRMYNAKMISETAQGTSADFTTQRIGVNENLLADIINQNEGKVQVIDVWTTWCPACIKEFEGYKELSEYFKNQDVTFIFLCAGGNKDKMIQHLSQNGLGGLPNRFCTEEENLFLHKTFKINYIPYGILVNRKGQIVDYGRYVRPSGLLKEKINTLLEND